MTLLPPPGERLWSLNAVRVPEGVNEVAVRKRLLDRHDIEIGAGLATLAGKIWRVGLMGTGATEANVTRVIEALAEAVRPANPRPAPHGGA
jgi:alanine-glyoxylate transaminase/serine-glyoxylate transaminase/serine-pyruvate transaminase